SGEDDLAAGCAMTLKLRQKRGEGALFAVLLVVFHHEIVNDLGGRDRYAAEALDFEPRGDVAESNRVGPTGAGGAGHAEGCEHRVAGAGGVGNLTRARGEQLRFAVAG